MNDGHPLPIALSAAVPLWIMQYGMSPLGAPSEQDFDEARAFVDDLGAHGDILMFGSKKKGEAAGLFNRLARSIAVLAFVPGGITIFGSHWEYSGDTGATGLTGSGTTDAGTPC